MDSIGFMEGNRGSGLPICFPIYFPYGSGKGFCSFGDAFTVPIGPGEAGCGCEGPHMGPIRPEGPHMDPIGPEGPP